LTSAPYADHRIRDYVDLVAAGTPAPGGGSVAAMTVSFAAALVAMAARCSSRQLAAHEQLAAEADRLVRDAAALADSDAEAYAAVLATRGVREADAGSQERYRQALQRATEVPLAVTWVAAQTAQLGSRVSRGGNPALTGDAATAIHLAVAAARAAAGLVEINVRTGRCDDDLVQQATANVKTALDARAVVTFSR
jgi:formiminotetrahydrofolate cyclodeaminase